MENCLLSYLLPDLLNKFLAIISAQNEKITSLGITENAIFRKVMTTCDTFICSTLIAWILLIDANQNPSEFYSNVLPVLITIADTKVTALFSKNIHHTPQNIQVPSKVETENEEKNTGTIKNIRFETGNLKTPSCIWAWLIIIMKKCCFFFDFLDIILGLMYFIVIYSQRHYFSSFYCLL